MSIRIYLTLSYLALILLMIVGTWAVADRLGARLTSRYLANAEQGSRRLIQANYQIAEKVLSDLGQHLIEMRAEGAAKGLALRLRGRNLADYAALRQDEELRRTATAAVQTPEGPAGFLMVYDKRGEILFHHLARLEGRNALDWQVQEYPEIRDMTRRSFTEERVFGYYAFRDPQTQQERKRYCARVQIPGTPFIVAANVNIDEFFLPAQAKIKEACQRVLDEAKGRIQESSRSYGRQIKYVTLMGGGILALLATISGLFFAAALSRPILGLRDGVEQVGEGDFAVTVPEGRVKEVAQLARSFNRLGQQLIEYIEKRDFIRDTFGRYVTQEVVKKLLESKEALELGGETREVSIIMSDLRGFTALVADMQPEQVIVFLNRYLGKMIEILLDHRAVIDEIVGDGILAFFGAPTPMEDHPLQAVTCALKMQEAMDEINALSVAEGLPHLETGIAVNTGVVVVGNIGSERRTKYSVVGSHVNLTSRIESFAVGGQVLISPSTYEQVKDSIEVGDVIEGEMKGLTGRATMYEVLGIKGAVELHLRQRGESPKRLPERIAMEFSRIRDKVIRGAPEAAWITHLGETAATIAGAGELQVLEDLRLHLLDDDGKEVPGIIYGKVASVTRGEDDLIVARIRFTSVSPEMERFIREKVAKV